jgi:hypothetical protein
MNNYEAQRVSASDSTSCSFGLKHPELHNYFLIKTSIYLHLFYNWYLVWIFETFKEANKISLRIQHKLSASIRQSVLPVHCQDTDTQQLHSETRKRDKYNHGCNDAVPNKKRVSDGIPAGGLVKFLSRELDAPHVEHKAHSPVKTEFGHSFLQGQPQSPQHTQNFYRLTCTYTSRSWKTRIHTVQTDKSRDSCHSQRFWGAGSLFNYLKNSKISVTGADCWTYNGCFFFLYNVCSKHFSFW